MSHWILNDYRKSLEVLLLPTIKEQELFNYPPIFNFYFYLHSHPLLSKLYKTTNNFSKVSSSECVHLINLEDMKVCERKLFFKTALFHLESGLPDIAFEVLSMQDLVTTNINNGADNIELNHDKSTDDLMTSQENNTMDWSKPVADQGNDIMDWSKPVTIFDEEDYKMEISLDDSNSDTVNSDNDNVKTLASIISDKSKLTNCNQKGKSTNKTDILSLNMKFICIMQCLIESLKALSSKCMLENIKLRLALSELLNHELAFLHLNCDYGFEEDLSVSDYHTEQGI